MKEIINRLMGYNWIEAPAVIFLTVGAFLGEQWNREIPLSNRLAKFFSVNDGSTFQMKGLYILSLVLLGLYILAAVPWAVWLYAFYAILILLFFASGIMFIRTFINKKEWTKDGQA